MPERVYIRLPARCELVWLIKRGVTWKPDPLAGHSVVLWKQIIVHRNVSVQVTPLTVVSLLYADGADSKQKVRKWQVY